MSPSHSLVREPSKDMEEKIKEYEKELMKERDRVSKTPSANVSSTTTPMTPGPTAAKPFHITPDSIPEIPPFRPRKSKEWAQPLQQPAEVGNQNH